MANNLVETLKKKLDIPDQVRLSAADRVLLEQTCKGLEEIKKQRLSEAAALEELKELGRAGQKEDAGFQASIRDLAGTVKELKTAADRKFAFLSRLIWISLLTGIGSMILLVLHLLQIV